MSTATDDCTRHFDGSHCQFTKNTPAPFQPMDTPIACEFGAEGDKTCAPHGMECSRDKRVRIPAREHAFDGVSSRRLRRRLRPLIFFFDGGKGPRVLQPTSFFYTSPRVWASEYQVQPHPILIHNDSLHCSHCLPVPRFHLPHRGRMAA